MMWGINCWAELIKSMYIDSFACVRVKGGESERFRIDSGYINFLWLFKLYMYAVMKEVKMGTKRRGVIFLEEEREWRLPNLLYEDDFVLCGESEEDLRAVVERFVEVCRRRGLKVNVGKSKVMVINLKDGLECEVHVDGIHLEQRFPNFLGP